MAKLFLVHVWKYHGLPDTIVSDRGPQFISEFWTELCRLLRIKVKLSTPYHAATDGQSENANKELEIFLRAYVNYHQDDWVDWLPSAEFSDNVKESVSTQVAPFEANYGFMPRMSFDWSPPSTAAKSKPAALSRDQAKEVAARMDNIWKDVV
jgi:transposase InsO family protein